MKDSEKNSFFKGIRIIINLALVFLLFCIIWTPISYLSIDNKLTKFTEREKPCSQVMTLSGNNTMLVLNNEKLSDCSYSREIIIKFIEFKHITIFVKLIFALFITLQLGLILKSFPSYIFKSKNNVKRIRYIALAILMFVLLDFVIRFYPRFIIPEYLVNASYGINSLRSGFMSSLRGLNFSLLFMSAVTFLLSVVFKQGTQLQKESDLTI